MKIITIILLLTAATHAAPPWGMPYTITGEFRTLNSGWSTYEGTLTLAWDDSQVGYVANVGTGELVFTQEEDDLVWCTQGNASGDWTGGIVGHSIVGEDFIFIPNAIDLGIGTQPLPTTGMIVLGLFTGTVFALLASLWHAPLRGLKGVAT